MELSEKVKKGLAACSSEKLLCTECPYYVENGLIGCRYLQVDALAYIRQLEAKLVNQATEYSQALKITTEQRDALKADILRATDKAHEMQNMLDNDVHPNCDYGLYCDLCDALGDVVAWEHKELLDTKPVPPEEEV